MRFEPKAVVFSQPVREVRVIGRQAAEEAVERLRQEREHAAYLRGRLEGERALSEQLVQQRAEVIELQNGVLDSLQQLLPQLKTQWESELIALALEVAQRFVNSIPITAEMLQSVIVEACRELEDSADYTIQLHPQDLELMRKANLPLELPGGNMERVTYQAAPDVGRGGCIIRTRFGAIDARRETKLELLKNALLT